MIMICRFKCPSKHTKVTCSLQCCNRTNLWFFCMASTYYWVLLDSGWDSFVFTQIKEFTIFFKTKTFVNLKSEQFHPVVNLPLQPSTDFCPTTHRSLSTWCKFMKLLWRIGLACYGLFTLAETDSKPDGYIVLYWNFSHCTGAQDSHSNPSPDPKSLLYPLLWWTSVRRSGSESVSGNVNTPSGTYAGLRPQHAFGYVLIEDRP